MADSNVTQPSRTTAAEANHQCRCSLCLSRARARWPATQPACFQGPALPAHLASSSASSCRPFCSSRRSRQGSTGWLSGSGCRHKDWGASGGKALLRTVRCMTPAGRGRQGMGGGQEGHTGGRATHRLSRLAAWRHHTARCTSCRLRNLPWLPPLTGQGDMPQPSPTLPSGCKPLPPTHL